MNCPKCGMSTTVYKCDNCGDVRCGSSGHGRENHGCNTKEGPFGKSGAGATSGGTCKSCGKGKYKKL